MIYSAYGCSISSPIPLGELSSELTQNFDLEVIISSPEEPSGEPIKWFHEITIDGQLCCRYGELCNSWVCDVPEIGSYIMDKELGTVKILSSKEPSKTIPMLMNQILPLWISLRGGLVLHASGVVIDNKVTLMIAESGVGKSTFLARMMSQGLQGVCDDAALIIQKNSGFYVQSSFPELRIDQQSEVLTPGNVIGVEAGKCRHDISKNFFQGQLPLEQVIFLQRSSSNELTEVSTSEVTQLLLANTYRMALPEKQRISNELSQLCALMDSVSMRLFKFKPDLSAIDALLRSL